MPPTSSSAGTAPVATTNCAALFRRVSLALTTPLPPKLIPIGPLSPLSAPPLPDHDDDDDEDRNDTPPTDVVVPMTAGQYCAESMIMSTISTGRSRPRTSRSRVCWTSCGLGMNSCVIGERDGGAGRRELAADEMEARGDSGSWSSALISRQTVWRAEVTAVNIAAFQTVSVPFFPLRSREMEGPRDGGRTVQLTTG